jgi:hypothetical protein
MKKLRKAVESAFDIPFDRLGLPATLQRLDPADPGGFLYGSPEAATRGVLVQGDIDAFVTEAPMGYCQVGFWGHGVNSYAFYLTRVTPGSRVHFRLPYGGAYGDERKDAGRVREFLLAFLEFEAAVQIAGGELLAVESMGIGRYRLSLPNSRVTTNEDSMMRSPEFGRVLGLTASGEPRFTLSPRMAAWAAYQDKSLAAAGYTPDGQPAPWRQWAGVTLADPDADADAVMARFLARFDKPRN